MNHLAPLHIVDPRTLRTFCSVDGCERRVDVRGLCSSHYRRLQRGRPVGGPIPETPAERFWVKVVRGTDDECWIWQGATDGRYGHVQRGAHFVQAHRVAYELLVGPIPDGLTLDHLCYVKLCVNPAHLEPVTMAENIRRGRTYHSRLQTHCKRGHLLAGDNLLSSQLPRRVCRACMAMYNRKRAKGRVS